jgi:hypothetical protein
MTLAELNGVIGEHHMGDRPMRAPYPQLLPALALAILLAPAGKAREPGQIDPVSRSTIAISASVAPQMHVSGIRHMDAAELASPEEARRFDLCVVANTSARSYSVTAAGPSNGAGDFVLHAGRPSQVIELEWNTVAARARLAPEVAASGFSAADRECPDGDTGTSLTIRAEPESGQLASIPLQPSALTIVIAPE